MRRVAYGPQPARLVVGSLLDGHGGLALWVTDGLSALGCERVGNSEQESLYAVP
jgi:hypothetical protein